MTIQEILRLDPNDRRNKYGTNAIKYVKIDNNVFNDYNAFSFLWEKSYVKSPTRSGNGSIENLNSYASFVTPHLKMDFKLMSIDTYRKIMKLLYSKNEFLVECYDIVYDKPIQCKMYFSTESMPTLLTITEQLQSSDNTIVELLGIMDYTIELIGTNSEISKVSVKYHSNPPQEISVSDVVVKSEETAINSLVQLECDVLTNLQTPYFSGYRFNGWKDNNNLSYMIDSEIVVISDLELFAQWIKVV